MDFMAAEHKSQFRFNLVAICIKLCLFDVHQLQTATGGRQGSISELSQYLPPSQKRKGCPDSMLQFLGVYPAPTHLITSVNLCEVFQRLDNEQLVGIRCDGAGDGASKCTELQDVASGTFGLVWTKNLQDGRPWRTRVGTTGLKVPTYCAAQEQAAVSQCRDFPSPFFPSRSLSALSDPHPTTPPHTNAHTHTPSV